MERRVIEIDQERCNGCGKCVTACAEGAIGLINGKARLLRDDYCDGLGNCLPVCPQDAIHFIVREASDFDETAVKRHMLQRSAHFTQAAEAASRTKERPMHHRRTSKVPESKLRQWPVQIQLVSEAAPYFDDADVLVAADCSAFAYGNFHEAFMDGRVTLIGCTKLDDADYADKLADIFRNHKVKSILVTRIDLPCCSRLESAVRDAVERSGKNIPVDVVTIATNGDIKEDTRGGMG